MMRVEEMATDSVSRHSRELSAEQRQRLRELLEERAAQGGYPLSAGQKALWFIQGLDPESFAYNVVFGARIRSSEGTGGDAGKLDLNVLGQVFRTLLQRHQSLRCLVEERQGEPWQRPLPTAEAPLEIVEASGLAEGDLHQKLRAFAERPFQLSEEIPCRFAFFQRGPDDGALVMVFHHVAVDFWSVGLLLEELHQLYPALQRGVDTSLPPLGESFRVFVDRQQQRLAGEEGAALRRYWRQRLGNQPPVLELPLDRPRPATQTFVGATREFVLPPRAALRLRHLSGLAGSTFFAAMLGLVQVLLHRWSGQQRLLVAAPVSGRGRSEIQRTVGYFVNLVALEADFSQRPVFLDFLRQVGSTALDALQHGELPFAEVVEALGVARDPSRAPLADVAFALESPRMDRQGIFPLLLGQSEAEAEIAGLRWQSLGLRQQEGQFDLNFHLLESSNRVDGLLMFRTDLFDPSTADRLIQHFCHLLESATAEPHRPISELSLVSAAERWQVLGEFNDRAERKEAPISVVESFVARARESSAAVALTAAGPEGTTQEWSYGVLESQTRQLAQQLVSRGVGAETVVATLLPSSGDLILAQLGILRAGGAYLSIDPSFPAERIEFLLQDSGAACVLTSGISVNPVVVNPGVVNQDSPQDSSRKAEAQGLPKHLGGLPVMTLENLSQEEIAESATLPQPAPEHLAYLIYTSGSTGLPKAVAISHGGLGNLVSWHLEAYGLEPRHRSSLLAGQSFDASVWETWPSLAAGASLHVAPGDLRLEPRRLWQWLADQRVSHAFAPTPLAEALLMEAPAEDLSLEVLLTGGDRLVRRPSRETTWRLVNHYGPSECAVVATAGEVEVAGDGSGLLGKEAARLGAPSLGRPIPGVAALVVDSGLEPVPLGIWGELVLGGASLARGYLGRAALTAQSFVPHPWAVEPGQRIYRTGDRVRYLADGRLEFHGRLDFQVKVRGFRIEPGEIEGALLALPDLEAAVVDVRRDSGHGPQLVAYVVPRKGKEDLSGGASAGISEGISADALKGHLEAVLPAHLVPSAFVSLAALPLNASGKVDRKALPAPPKTASQDRSLPQKDVEPRGDLEARIAAAWAETLGIEEVGRDDSFFEVGGHSLLLARLATHLEERVGQRFSPVELLRFPTIRSLAEHLRPSMGSPALPLGPRSGNGAETTAEGGQGSAGGPLPSSEPIAIVGVAGRFPGAENVEQLWQLLSRGEEAISPLTEEELRQAGVPEKDRTHPRYVAVASRLPGVDQFDAAFFGMGPREAEILDPQQRLFLECSWEALEDAAYVPGHDDRTGVFAGLAKSSYQDRYLDTRPDLVKSVGAYQLTLANDKDFLPTRVAYRLGLHGPAVAVQTACSTSLVAIHMACQSLRLGECDMALAGGVAVRLPQDAGYRHESGMILSPDGHCRPFDAEAGGTVGGNGVGAVLLKPLSSALRDGDPIRAVIRGSAINNDGSLKAGYTAPSVEGQARAISAALESARVDPETIGYVEAHGTGTVLGDPIEVEALNLVFGGEAESETGGEVIALGAIKSNLGHLDAASGVTGLIKTVLCLERGEIPPTLHFETPNPRIDFAGGPFQVQSQLGPFPRKGDSPRRAGVSSFGIGGTNAHAVLEEAPSEDAGSASSKFEILPLSARTETALEASREQLAAFLETAFLETASPQEAFLGDTAYTLQTGRKGFQERTFVVCGSPEQGAEALRDLGQRLQGKMQQPARPLAFLFPGQGSQYLSMAKGLYDQYEVFRSELDRCSTLLEEDLGLDLRTVIFPQSATSTDEQSLRNTALAQPAIFAVEYSLACLWRSLGVRAEALLGHSIGEYVAACWAGVMELAAALKLVAARGRLIQALPGGSMLSVAVSEAEAKQLLRDEALKGVDLDLAAINGPNQIVLSGSSDAIARLAQLLTERQVDHRLLHTSHAFHSRLLAPALGDFRKIVEQVELSPPSIPFLSNVTGTWILPEEATDPEYWVEHVRRPVRFLDGVQELADHYQLLEVGPGRTLDTFARAATGERAISTLRHPRRRDDDLEVFLKACGRLWIAGVEVQWEALHETGRRRQHLPTYPFERQRYWVDAAPAPEVALEVETAPDSPPKGLKVGRLPVEDWLQRPAWTSAAPVVGDPTALAPAYLLFLDREGVGEALSQRLRQGGSRVVTVAAGDGFEALGDDVFVIDPSEPGDYVSLQRSLGENLPRDMVHLWNCGTVSPEDTVFPEDAVFPENQDSRANGRAEEWQRGQDLSFSSLLYLARALPHGTRAGEGAVGSESVAAWRLWVASQAVYRVMSSDAVDPMRALLLGPCRVLPEEQPSLQLRHVDLPGSESRESPEAAERLADLLFRELIGGTEDLSIAYRGGERWRRTFEPVQLPQVAPFLSGMPPGAVSLRPRGIYLITGGFGGVGLEIAQYLAQRVAARLVLVGRNPLPPGEAWQQRLESAGADVLALAADVTDEASMALALDTARQKFGEIHGLIHAAGVAGGGMARHREPAAMAAVLAPKVQGTRVLSRLLGEAPLDFSLLCSSLTSELGGFGQTDYVAANAFLDAFCESGGLPSMTTVNWDLWRGLGMAALPLPKDLAHLRASLERLAMSPEEGCEIMERALASPLPRVAVSTIDLERRMAGSVFDGIGPDGKHREVDAAAAVPHPEAEPSPGSVSSLEGEALETTLTPTTSVAATETQAGGLEAVVAKLWQELLGVDRVGLHDDFFELGGHSLMGTRVLARLEDEVEVSLPLSSLFEHSTVAQLAAELKRRGAASVGVAGLAELAVESLPTEDPPVLGESSLAPVEPDVGSQPKTEPDPGDALWQEQDLSDEAVESLLLSLMAEEA